MSNGVCVMISQKHEVKPDLQIPSKNTGIVHEMFLEGGILRVFLEGGMYHIYMCMCVCVYIYTYIYVLLRWNIFVKMYKNLESEDIAHY